MSAWINQSVTHSVKNGKNNLLCLNRYVSVTKMVANFSTCKGCKIFFPGPICSVGGLNYGLIHSIASNKLIQNVISKLQQHMHIQKQKKRKEGEEIREGKGKRDEIKRESVELFITHK